VPEEIPQYIYAFVEKVTIDCSELKQSENSKKILTNI
jgi:hypothetical protein